MRRVLRDERRRGVMEDERDRAAYRIASWVTAIVFVGGAVVMMLWLLGVVLRALGA